MLKITREDDAEYLKSLAAVRKKAADSVHEFICGGPVVVPAPETPVTVALLAVPPPLPASVIPDASEAAPSGYDKWREEYYAKVAARPPGTPFPLGHPQYDQSKDPIFNPSLKTGSGRTYDCPPVELDDLGLPKRKIPSYDANGEEIDQETP